MKKKKILDSFDLLDEKYVEEAASASIMGKRSKKIRFRVIMTAACISVVIATLCMWLFIPYKDTKNRPEIPDFNSNGVHRDYREVVEKLYAYYYGEIDYTTNFEQLLENLGNTKDDSMDFTEGDLNGGNSNGGAMGNDMVLDGNGNGSDQSYHETTDNQVEGVIEADIIKRSDRYIYYIDDSADELLVYSIEGEDSRLISRHKLSAKAQTSSGASGASGSSAGATTGSAGNLNSHTGSYYTELSNYEGYLSADCRTFTVIASYYSSGRGTIIISIDVSDPENITERSRVSLTGNYVTSRLIDGKLLVLNRFDVSYRPDFFNASDYIPEINTGNGFECIPPDSILCAEKINSPAYSVICMMDSETLEVKDSMALLSFVDTSYVSQGSVYLANRNYINNTVGDITESKTVSEIRRINYTGNGFDAHGCVTVDGYLKDQYSLDEHNGILRVVTTTDYQKSRVKDHGNFASSTRLEGGTSANLYCIELLSMTVVASVESFAPTGETVRSVRFDGTDAYVCTAIQITDPVFFFDLSNLNDIKVKDTGTIAGFSTSLINMGNGYLLGIGTGGLRSSTKIEIYKESEEGVVSVCKSEMIDTYYANDYKAYFIDRERNLVGLGVDTYYYPTDVHRYILFHFDEETETLTELVHTPIEGYVENKRAVLIDGYFYILADSYFKVIKVDLP